VANRPLDRPGTEKVLVLLWPFRDAGDDDPCSRDPPTIELLMSATFFISFFDRFDIRDLLERRQGRSGR
jgi:hypothetical protein